MNKEEIINQLKEILNKYPDKQREILLYIFGRDNLIKMINEPTYEELLKENKQLKEKISIYENPEDLTLMFMYCEEKAKDKIKELLQENQKYKEVIDKATNELFILKDMIYKPETREENFEIQRKISSIIKRLNGKEV